MPVTVHRSIPLALAACMLLLGGCAPDSSPETAAPARVGLIVVGPDATLQQACVTVDDVQATGRVVLQESGLPFVLDERNAMGALVCSIGGLGCEYPSEACLCQCEELGQCTYWAYFVRMPPGEWIYSTQGVSAQPVRSGELHAWLWLDASRTGTQALSLLPDVEYEAICP